VWIGFQLNFQKNIKINLVSKSIEHKLHMN
jgi:hypothetical protein